MISTRSDAAAPPTTAQASRTSLRAARLNARIAAYLIDTALLLGFVLVFLTIAGVILLLASNKGRTDAPDSAYYAFIAVLLGGTVIAWSAFNLALMSWRGQTAGMYVIGIRTVGGGVQPLPPARVLVRWLALHPLLFHPLLLPLWALFSLLAVSVTLSQAVLVIMLGLLLLCVVAPVTALLTVLLDPEHRALHDRVSGALIVHLDQP